MKRKTQRSLASMVPIIGLLLSGFLMSCSILASITSSVPTAPTGVTVTGTTCTAIEVNWTPVSGASSYTVYYTDDGTTPSEGTNTGYFDSISAPPYTFIPDSNASPIQVAVSATNNNGEGNISSIVTGSPLAPANITVTVDTGTTTDTFALTWAPVAGAATYTVYRSLAASESQLTAPNYSSTNPYNTSNTSCHWNVSSSNLEDYFEFAVAGVDSAGNIGPLSPVSTPLQP
jgi:fibronectin type 3 domain-containing protein